MGLIQDWSLAEKYCKEVANLKRRELERKRAKDPKHRENLKKAHKKRADDPERSIEKGRQKARAKASR